MASKRKKQNRIRITGLVKAMNHARTRLSQGIPPEEQEDFRRWIRSLIHQIDQICSSLNIKHDQLPAPSRRAYEFLSSIDLKNLPQQKDPDTLPNQSLRISGLITSSQMIQDRIVALTQSARDSKISKTEVNDLSNRIRENVERVESICRAASTHWSDLPPQSRRAFLWLKFLSHRENLQSHLEASRLAYRYSQNPSAKKLTSHGYRKHPLRIEFYHLNAIYHIRPKDGHILLTLSEGFITAPKSMIEVVVKAALSGKGNSLLNRVREYCNGETYIETIIALEGDGYENSQGAQGQHFDLQEIFQAVNSTYFSGKLDQPKLVWNKTITHRKLGHYQPSTDTVMISITLDHPRVPAYVVEFIMYHELLHKALGLNVVNGRHYAHTGAFRKAEAKFKKYREAQEFLSALGDKVIL